MSRPDGHPKTTQILHNKKNGVHNIIFAVFYMCVVKNFCNWQAETLRNTEYCMSRPKGNP